MSKDSLTLFELNNKIKNVISCNFNDSFWITCEISDIKENFNGHCYLELIEKDKDSENIIARSKAIIWSFTYRILKPYFETTTGRKFDSGLKILVNASVEFHELYGLSLNIKDIEPSYTVGDLELQRLKIVERLKNEGVINMNKQLPFPIVPQKIAIISSSTAAGYEDFVNQLENNDFGYKFYYKLFPASMQGANTEESVISSLDKIYKYENSFDLVVLIRGGGSKSDLSSFDSYWLAYNITQFPIPVITGIGHERDNCIVDLVAHSRLKTPTAVAEFIINKVNEFENNLIDIKTYISEAYYEKTAKEKSNLDLLFYKYIPLINQIINNQNYSLNNLKNKLESEIKDNLHSHNQQINNNLNNLININKNNYSTLNNKLKLIEKSTLNEANQYINKKYHNLDIYQNAVNLTDPVNILKRGYSITYSNGKVIRDKNTLKKGEIIKTRLIDCNIESNIIDINDKKNNL